MASAGFSFDPTTGNSVTIPVSARVADVRLNFTGNTGAPAGQVAELQVMGVPAPGVYGATNNVFRNLYAADMVTYPGVTISSFDSGIPMNGFGGIWVNELPEPGEGHAQGAVTFNDLTLTNNTTDIRNTTTTFTLTRN